MKAKYEMKRLESIIQSLDVNIVSNEKYYKLNNLRECLSSMLDENIEVSASIFTPYYIAEGKRMELYEYELNIVTETGESFDMQCQIKKCFDFFCIDNLF